MGTVRKSLAYSLAENYLGVLLQLLSTLIISRLLTPQEIGVFAIAAVFSSIASTFRDFGVAEYLIQAKELNEQRIRSALSANILVSWLMAVAMFIGSGPAGTFYRDPGVAQVMQVLAFNFLLIPFGAVTMAYFRREMDYRPIFLSNLAANLVGFVVVLATAFAGWGYMSMAWSSLANVLTTVLMSMAFRPRSFPRWPGLKGLREVVQFGKHATGIYVFSQIGRSAPEAVVGRVLDVSAVAFFSRANGLMEIFNRTVLRAVLPLCLPFFAKSARSGGQSSQDFSKAVVMLTGIGWPFFLVIGLLAFGAIRLLYGPQWLSSVALAQILCLAAVLELPYYMAGELLIALGRINLSTRLQFLTQGLRVLGLLAVIPYGLEGACWGLTCAALAGALVSQHYVQQQTGLRLIELMRACLPSAGVALVCALPTAALVVSFGISEQNYLWMLPLCGLASAGAWLWAARHWRHPAWQEVQLIFNKLIQRTAPPAP